MISQYTFRSGCRANLNRLHDDTFELVFTYPRETELENIVRTGSRELVRELMRALDSEFRFELMANGARCY